MPRGKKRAVTEILRLLRDVQIEVAGGRTVEEACRSQGIAVNSYYKWRNRYAGMTTSEALDAVQLRVEVSRLRKIVADQAVDLSVLREALKGKW
jgi:transposase-like protein